MKIINYLPFIGVLFIWVIFTLYVFVNSPRVHTSIKMIVIPLAIVASVLSFRAADLNAGYAMHTDKLPQRFMYLGHKVIINEKFEKIGIDVWAQQEHTTRLYGIPWNKQMEDALNKAQEKKMGSKGKGDVEMNKRPGKPGKPGKPGEDEDENHEPYDSNLKLPDYNRGKPDFTI
jgi:hypothetical protein